MARYGQLALLLVLAGALGASAQISQVKLPYKLDAIEPGIDKQTMSFHYGVHYATYVNNTNAALANATGLASKTNLTDLIMNIGKLSSPLNTTIRNQGGGAWNHALYFRHLTSPSTSASASTGPLLPLGKSSTAAASKELTAAVTAAFGSWDGLITELTTAATKVFGSGWAWLCYNTDGKLVVTSTPNQDNPLMGNLPGAPPVKYAGCTPILGVDVWEHAYYLKHGPKRAAYLKDFFTVVDYAQISKNFANAQAGKADDMVKP